MKLYFLLIFYAFLYLIHPNAHSHNPSDEIDTTASPPVQKRIRSSEPPEPIDGPLPLTGFSALPDDIVLHIIQFLDPDDQGLQSLHLANKRLSHLLTYVANKKWNGKNRTLTLSPLRLQLLGQLPSSHPDDFHHYASITRLNFDHIQTMRLCIDGLSQDNIDQIKKLVHALPSFPALRSMEFFYTDPMANRKPNLKRLLDTVAVTNTQIRHLSSLDFSNVSLMPEVMPALALGLRHFKNLESLDLSQNELGGPNISLFIRTLGHLTHLKKLNLDGACVEDSGLLLALASLFQPQFTTFTHGLQVLNLDSNNLSDRGVKALAAVLPYFHQLKELHLNHNNFGCQGTIRLAQTLHNCRPLEKLGLQDNGIRSAGFVAILKALHSLPHFQNLQFGANDLEPDEMDNLQKTHAPDPHWSLDTDEY